MEEIKETGEGGSGGGGSDDDDDVGRGERWIKEGGRAAVSRVEMNNFPGL